MQATGLERWFMSFADARNTIIHQGVVPSLVYTNASNAEYEGPLVFNAEFLLRAIIKVSLAQFGLSRSVAFGRVARPSKPACEELEAPCPSA